jgi:hypothetical protein
MKPLTPEEEERQGLILAFIFVGILALFFIAWIHSLAP